MVNSEDDAKQIYMMMQKAVKFSFNKIVVDYLKNTKNGISNTGQIKLKKLVKQDQSLNTMEFKDENTKAFEKYAKKCNISFSVIKEQTEEDKLPTFKIFFKAKDEIMIQQAFEMYSMDKIKQSEKGEQNKDFSLEKLKELKDIVKAKNQERDVSKNKHQDQSL